MNHQTDAIKIIIIIALVLVLGGVIWYFGGNQGFTGTALNTSGNKEDPGSTSSPCSITSFTAGPTSVSPGGSSMLKYATKDCTTATIDKGIGSVSPVSGGSKSTGALTATTTFTLTASGGSKTTTATATVTVGAPVSCAINSFTADDTSIYTGETTNLNWSATSGCTIATITDFGNVSPISGGTKTTPALSATKTYIFSVGDGTAGPAITKSVTITVSAAPRCAITKFSASPTTVVYGASATLSWVTTNCDTGNIDQGIGAATPIASGSKSTGPLTSTKTFKLTADTIPADIAASYLVTVTVGSAPRCVINSFTASPTSVAYGESTTLSWNTSDCNTTTIDQAINVVSPVASGSISTGPLTASTTFKLTADTIPPATAASYLAIVTVGANPDPGDPDGNDPDPDSGGGGGGGSSTNECNDDDDNDGDGLFDYPYDPGCTSTSDDDEYNAPTAPGTIAPTFVNGVCAPYLTTDISFGSANNNAGDVTKLEQFLNIYQGEALVVNGIYEQADVDAVNRFQLKYSSGVLSIWGLTAPTGFVGPTTRNKINSLVCGLSVTCPVFSEYNSLTLNNNTPEVVTTKQVLQNLGFSVGALTPIYDQTLFYAMKAFQEKFHEVMLDPWGISVGTGYKYKTTNKYLNLLGGCDTGPVELEGVGTFDY